ncbi:MAG: tRNA (adenosine(37)-N6)-threonylcarbamoyltransferase complex transferase subunit TsaD [Candidatus Marsarchaeota archaeon]|nr:tRNA (adenosine(37)-N6)-threonylcarbamoyltransferase complex transferase subunit TsaD [Candidatus Marsarchaeota archaeon]
MVDAVIGIESTAHTIGVGICSLDGDILYNKWHTYTTSQGGIHPREAARHHARLAPSLVADALGYCRDVSVRPVAVASALGPGLGPCLRTGAVAARALSQSLSLPFLPVNHLVAHVEVARKFCSTSDPVTLFVSGGNTAVVLFRNGRYRMVGETLDIALGNMLDVLGREMGYGFPSGPKVLELAEKGTKMVDLPYTVKGQDMSFSGLLTKCKKLLSSGFSKEDVAKSAVETAFAMVVEVVERTVALSGSNEVSLTGGVARSRRLADMLSKMCSSRGAKLSVVPSELSGDNGGMISYVGSLMYGLVDGVRIDSSKVVPRWRIEQVPIPWRKS